MNKWDSLELTDKTELLGVITKETEQDYTVQRRDTRQSEVVPKTKVKRSFRRGRPILVGTVSIESSEKNCRNCSKSVDQHIKSSTPNITNAKPKSSPKPVD